MELTLTRDEIVILISELTTRFEEYQRNKLFPKKTKEIISLKYLDKMGELLGRLNQAKTNIESIED